MPAIGRLVIEIGTDRRVIVDAGGRWGSAGAGARHFSRCSRTCCDDGSRGACHLQKFSVRNNQTARYQVRQLLVDHGFELWTAPLETKRPAYCDKNVFAAHGPILGKNLQDGGLRFRGGQICSVLDAER